MLTLYVNVASNRILDSNNLDAVLPKFVRGDQVPLKLIFVDQDFNQIAPPTSVCVALSKLGQKPSDGTFTLTYGGDTTAAIAFGATAAQVSSALNALASITAAGGITVSGAAGGPYSIVFVTAGARTAFTNDAELLYPASQIITNVEVTGTATVRHRVTIGLSRNPAAFVDSFTKTGEGAEAYLTGVLNLATSGIEAILGTSDIVTDAVLEVQTVTGGEQTTVQRRDVMLVSDVIDGAPSTPAPNSSFATLQQVEDALAAGGVGVKTPVELTESITLSDDDTGKYYYNTGADDLVVSVGSSGLGTNTAFDGTNPQGPITIAGNMTWNAGGAYWSFSISEEFQSTITTSATVKLVWDASPCAPNSTYFVVDGVSYDQKTAGEVQLASGAHTVYGGAGSYDYPRINFYKEQVAGSGEVSPLTNGQEVSFHQGGAGTITIDSGANTVVTKNGRKTDGVGSLITLKRISDGLYHLTGDTTT